MVEVIYADILFIVNVYVNYALLKITEELLKRTASIKRTLLSSAFGGIYAFIILFPNMPNFLVIISRVLFAFLIVLMTFGYKSRKVYLRSVAVFFAVSFVFSGLMYFLWEFFSPGVMAYGNTVVYFDIDTLDLCVMTIVCYGLLKLLDLLLKGKQPQNLMFDTSIYIEGRTFVATSFLDTGNSLCEPFSSYPVIVVNESIKSKEENKERLIDFVKRKKLPLRYVLCNTLSDNTLLSAFKPNKVRIKGIDIDFETTKVYIALTNKEIKGGDYGALLGSSVFEGKTSETERDYDKQSV